MSTSAELTSWTRCLKQSRRSRRYAWSRVTRARSAAVHQSPLLQPGLAVVLSGQQNLKLCLLSWSVISQEAVMPADQDAETHEEQEDVDAELEALAMECVGFCLLALL